MAKIVVTEFISLDGVIEGPGPDDPFPLAGWTMSFWNQDIGQFKFNELQHADALLLGRLTYDGFAKAWPNQKDEQGFADRMNNLPKYVVSGTLTNSTWNNTRIIGNRIVEQIESLRQTYTQTILVPGSSLLTQTLIDQKLVDEFNLLVYPVVLGQGKKLFQHSLETPLTLLESRPFNTGVVLLHYSI